MNLNVFPLHFSWCLVFHVALLVCKFWQFEYECFKWKTYPKKQWTNEIIEERMSWGFYASSLERKQEKWIVGVKWAWCRGYSHIDKAWPSRLLPAPWMCPRGSKIEPCSFWTYVITSRWTSCPVDGWPFPLLEGQIIGQCLVFQQGSGFLSVCFAKCSLRGLGQTSVGDAMGQHRQWSSMLLLLLHIMVFSLQLHPGGATSPAVLSESIQISSIYLLV